MKEAGAIGNRSGEGSGSLVKLALDRLHPFRDHPFRPYTKEKMDEMVQSVRVNGVLSPILVRPDGDGGYEIISGHNRAEACRLAGFDTVPTTVWEVDDDTCEKTKSNG